MLGTPFLTWRAHNSPHFGPLYDDMRRRQAHFKYGLWQCKKDLDRKVSDSLAKKPLVTDNKSFWSEIKKVNNDKVSSGSTSIGGAVGKDNICDMWQQHFKDILNSSKDTRSQEYVLENIRSIHSDINMLTVFLCLECYKRPESR